MYVLLMLQIQYLLICRNYYRCTHKFDQGCITTKQVQNTEDEPPKYKIIYNGQLSCNNLRNPQPILDSSNPKDKTIILNFEMQGPTKTKQVDLSQGLRQASSLDQCLSLNLTKQVTLVRSNPIFMTEFLSNTQQLDIKILYQNIQQVLSYSLKHSYLKLYVP